MKRWIVFLFAICTAAACSWQPAQPLAEPQVSRAPATPTVVRSEPTINPSKGGARDSAWIAATVAEQQLGVPYRYGGKSPSGFDCSGLVHFAYAEAGISVPRTTGGLWSAARPISSSDAQPGDILFFRFDGKPSHVGIYLGDGYFVHAPSTGRTVSKAHLSSSFYSARLIRAGRLDL